MRLRKSIHLFLLYFRGGFLLLSRLVPAPINKSPLSYRKYGRARHGDFSLLEPTELKRVVVIPFGWARSIWCMPTIGPLKPLRAMTHSPVIVRRLNPGQEPRLI